MAKRDQFGGTLGRHNPGELGYSQYVAFLQHTLPDKSQGLGSHLDLPGGDGNPLGVILRANVDHVSVPLRIQVGQFATIHA
jgi:hypothetical protein